MSAEKTENTTSSSEKGEMADQAPKSYGLSTAVWALRFAVFADAVNSQILGPNYALMVLDEGHVDSFPTTAPFDFGGAYYFIPMCADIGTVISSLGFGYLSDKIGRKKCILACMYLGAIGSILKFFAQHNFWLFCAANFFTGLFGGTLAVGMAYASDVFLEQKKVDAEIGTLVAVSMIGRTGGGVVAILMQDLGLFEPLWVTAGVSAIAGLANQFLFRDQTTKLRQRESIIGSAVHLEAIDEDADGTRTKSMDLDKRALANVLLGELFDNLGSIGLVPICISPLMFNTFYSDFFAQGLDPVMSSTAYKWIYVLVAVIVVPGAALAPIAFQKIGPALSAVLANLFTGTVTIVLLWISKADATTATFAIFVAVLYVSFPMTVISQLSTGPMLDRISPEDQRGKIQGYNMAMMNLAGAIGPFLLGNLLDATSIDVCLYTTAGISVVAAIVNFPLSRHARLGPTPSDDPTAPRASVSRSSILVASQRRLSASFVAPPTRLSFVTNV